MFTILNNNTAVINCDDLPTAIRFVQSLEAGLDRIKSHSPYTIVKSTLEADVHAHNTQLITTTEE